MYGACSAHGRDEKYLKGRVHLEDLDVDGRILLKWISKKQGEMIYIYIYIYIYTLFTWQKIVTGSGLLSTW
jgi:hypothetical protein